MQKRKGRSSIDMQLPLTTSDLSNHNSNTNHKHRPTSRRTQFFRSHKHYSSSSTSNGGGTATTLLTCFLFFIVIFLVGFLLHTDFDFVVSNHPGLVSSTTTTTSSSTSTTRSHAHSSSSNNSRSSRLDSQPLSKFKTLQYPLSHSKLVGLYFAASWCPMSTSVTQSLERIFSNDEIMASRVLKEEEEEQKNHQPSPSLMKDFSLVYISSDYSYLEMKDYMKWNWIGIPYDSTDRNDIKRYFSICAQNEMSELGILSRRSQIPALIIFDSVTQDVISTNGVADLETYGEEVLDHWLEIQSLMRALEDKYV